MLAASRAPAFLALVLLVSSCAGPGPAPGEGEGRAEAPAGAGPPRIAIEDFLARYPAQVEGPYGITDSSRYDHLPRQRLQVEPYTPYDGPVRASVASYFGFRDLKGVVQASRVIVVGTVRAISRPHFVSEDGGFWDPALHDQPGIPEKAEPSPGIFRDVLFRVEEVLGAEVPEGMPEVVPGGDIVFLVEGGQIEVTLSAVEAEVLEEPGGAGTYLYARESPLELKEGERALVFLDYELVEGLYAQGYGGYFQLLGSGFFWKYELDGDLAWLAWARDDPTWHITLPELRDLARRYLGAGSGGPEPVVPGFVPTNPDPHAGAPPGEIAVPAT